MNKSTLYTVVLVLTVVGALNRGLVGFFQFDLVATLFGAMTTLSRVVYALVGLSGLYVLAELLGLLGK